MPSTNPSYLARKSANMSKACRASGCYLPRPGLDAFCSGHRTVYRRYGHETAGPLPKLYWTTYRKKVDKLFSLNASHAGLVEAERYITDMLTRAVHSTGAFKGAIEFQRLQSHGVSARSILVEAVAVVLALHDTPSLLPDDRARAFAVARAVFALAPRLRRQSWSGTRVTSNANRAAQSSLAYVGLHLQQSLAEFATTTHAGLAAMAKAASMTAEDRKAARTAPMRVS